MLDSVEWSSRPTVADRDLAPALLESIMGWPQVVRFWLPSWIRDHSALLDRVDTAVAVANEREVEHAVGEQQPMVDEIQEPTGFHEDSATVPAQRAGEGAVVTEQPSPFVPYVPTPLGSQTDIDIIGSDRGVQEAVRETLREVIAAEGPIEQNRLARLTLARFGFARTREDRRAKVLALVDPEVLHHHPTIGTFAWPAGIDPQTWRGYRATQVSADRPFEEVPPEEVANALAHALESTPHLGEEQLLRTALELLGYRRMTEKLDMLLRYGLQIAVTSGRIRSKGEGRYRIGH
jgi:hypothetical protein